jgi:hypothetical protein
MKISALTLGTIGLGSALERRKVKFCDVFAIQAFELVDRHDSS